MKSFYRRLFQDIIGLVFFVSSILKLMDPTGTGLIVDAYLSNWHLDFLRPASKVLGECISAAEAVVSIALLTGAFRVFFAWLSTAMILFFTGVGIWLVAANPDMSCGCFGEAIPLTHTQTLMKNIFLALCCIPAFVPYRNLGKSPRHRMVAFWTGLAIMLCFSIYSYSGIPLVDYTEFAPSHTIVSEGTVYESEWEYPTLTVWDEYGEDCSEQILDGDVVILSYYEPEKVDVTEKGRAAAFAQDALNTGFTPVVLSAGGIGIPGVETYSADLRKLLTLNRSNGGATFLHDGYIIGKTSAREYLSQENMEKHLTGQEAVETYIKAATIRSLVLQGFIIVFLAVLILV